MRPLIIEGPDATGKSTLAKYLSDELGYVIKESEGPTRSFQDMSDRLYRYEQLIKQNAGAVIFVRHPLISEPIYGTHLRNDPRISFTNAEHELKLMVPKPIIIYCDKPEQEVVHQLKLYDTPGFVDALTQAAPAIRDEYYNWVFIGLGAFYYQIGMDMRYVKCQVENSRIML